MGILMILVVFGQFGDSISNILPIKGWSVRSDCSGFEVLLLLKYLETTL